MKNKLIFGLLAILCLALIWCSEPAWNNEVGDEDWLSVAEWYCENEWWEVEMWEELNGYQPVCIYADDESYCYLEYLYNWLCSKWEFYYFDDYTYAEQACIDSNGQISQTEEWEDICILSDDEFCYMSDVMDWACDLLSYNVQDVYDEHESERAYQEYISECYDQPQVTVCGQDGNPYYNRCFMEKAGVQEEVELAEVVNGECIYG